MVASGVGQETVTGKGAENQPRLTLKETSSTKPAKAPELGAPGVGVVM